MSYKVTVKQMDRKIGKQTESKLERETEGQIDGRETDR